MVQVGPSVKAAGSKSAVSKVYDSIAAFNVESLFVRKRPAGPPRTIYVNEALPTDYFNKGKVKKEHVYTSNQVITSKYNLITFLPRNLLEQFRRVANIFFLGIAILQFFPKFSTIAPGAVILPLIVILAVTALKDGYEDFRRHQSDNKVNFTKIQILDGGNWANQNANQGKSKTVLQRLMPERKPTTNDTKDDEEMGQNRSVSNGDAPRSEKPYWRNAFWEDVKVGDFVKILENEPIPADILICSTSEEENVAFVETKNLDGETNLKSRHGVPALTHLRTAQDCADPQNHFIVRCDRPDTDMYRLNGNVTFDDSTSPVDLSMTLLRGTVLKNTRWVIGVVLFTGLDSKIVMNAGGTPSKRSKVERQMNPQVFTNLIILGIMATACGVADSLLEQHYYPTGALWLFNDNQSDDNPKINGVVTWAFSLLTFQIIVPISLYISIEFVKTCQAAFIYFDYDIYYAKTKQATLPRSWNLSDDLGQIEYIFSDKTGTLTQNLMVFRMCSVAGRAYRGVQDEADAVSDKIKSLPSLTQAPISAPVPVNLWEATEAESSRNQSQDSSATLTTETNYFKDAALTRDIQAAMERFSIDIGSQEHTLYMFFLVLSLCHTVLTGKNSQTGDIEYKAQSPDEAALVQAAADIGFVFLGKDKEVLSLRVPGSKDIQQYELLDILEFTSARKRMSVVLRKLGDGNGGLLLLSKGADNVIFERLLPGDEDLKEETENHLGEFANTGLRTLTLAYRDIPETEYRSWSRRYQEAIVAMERREEQVEEVSNELEQNLHLLGATAIEDRLQDGVPEAIADLKKAGIKVWVATGDKLETAIAIGRSTNLISSDSNILIVRKGSIPIQEQMQNALDQFFSEEGLQLSEKQPPVDENQFIPLKRFNTGVTSIVGEHNGERPGGFVLVVDGAALLDAFADEENKAILLRLAILCEGVICCRVSPLQKALVVRLVKDGLGAMTLAIGDGANDVSMIQAADVGIGISGEEGLQAVNSSDYAIAQFRFLKKLLLVHGHWSYARNGVMILNFFYKNIVPIGILWWFQIYSAWSGYYVFDYIYILFWNSLWTIAPVIGIGLFDRFLDSHVLMAVPELYRYGREGTWFSMRLFTLYMLEAVYQSAIIFFFIFYTYDSTTSRKDGYDIYQYEFSTTMALAGVLVANMFTGFTATAWTYWLLFAVTIGIIVQWVFTIIYSLISPGYAVTRLFGNDTFLFTSAYFWLCLPLVFCLSMLPRYMVKAYKMCYNPDDLETFQYLQSKYPNQDLSRFSRSSKAPALGELQEIQQQHETRHAGVRAPASRPSLDVRSASRMDMSTGLYSTDRGFDFATEEGGVMMRRVQTNLSERRMQLQVEEATGRRRPSGSSKGKETLAGLLSLRKSFLKKKTSNIQDQTTSSSS
ncbi:phospholipid-translocating ATPase [Panaeolus papilionaceus]|nr:phospholipid-translocating ATPase [Panaeolus papilionaceus]